MKMANSDDTLCTTGAKKKKAKPSKPEDEQVKQLQQRLDSGREAGPSDQYGRYRREDPEKMAAVKGRTWKAGSGARPGKLECCNNFSIKLEEFDDL